MSGCSGQTKWSVAFLSLMVLLPAQGLAKDLTATRALEAAIDILLGNPYGATVDKVKQNIKRQEKVGADDPECRAAAWKFVVSVPPTENNPDGINGFLCLSLRDGSLLSAGLPYLD
jgi:hypothetical protein